MTQYGGELEPKRGLYFTFHDAVLVEFLTPSQVQDEVEIALAKLMKSWTTAEDIRLAATPRHWDTGFED